MKNKFYCSFLVFVMILTLVGCEKEEVSYDHDKDVSLKHETGNVTVLDTSGNAQKKDSSYVDVQNYTFAEQSHVTITNTDSVFYTDGVFEFSNMRKGLSTLSFEIKGNNSCLFKNFILQVEYFDKDGNSIGVLNTEACDFLSEHRRYILINLPEEAESLAFLGVNCSQSLLSKEADLSKHSFEDGCSAGEVSKESANYFKYHLSGNGIIMLMNSDDCIITSVRNSGSKSSFTSTTFGADSFIYYEE